MAENLPSNTAPKAMVRNEFFSEGMAKPDTGTVPSTFRQAAEGTSHHISGRCEENKDNDDENLSDTSDAASENIQTIDIGPGEFDTYAIAYICKEQTIRMKKAVEETKSKPFQATKTAPDNTYNDNDTETSAFNANDSNMHAQARDPNPTYTQNMNPQPMYAENDVNPNPMYLQSTMEPIASPGPARNPNPMYTHNATNTSPTHSRNDVNPNPMYLQSSSGPTFKSNKSDDNPCTQTSADTHQQAFSRPATNNDDNHCLQPYAVTRCQPDALSLHIMNLILLFNTKKMKHSGDLERNTTSEDLSSQNQNQPTAASNNDVLHALDPNPMYAAADMCQGDVGWNTASEGTQGSLSFQNQPAAASNSINDANDVLHALNPNLMYVPNVQHPAAYGCTRSRVILAVEAAFVLGLFIVAGVFLWLSLSARPPQLPAVCNTPHYKGESNTNIQETMS
ncbi:hypothetical protein Bbelb_287880 [Branchiostoma belcheri]|nr:hypothetical protein Bbelb_287880 [Branchiostoma belcheri]